MTSDNNPDRDELFAKVAAAVAEQKSMDVSEIQLDSKFDDLGVDSLDAMEILFELEEELDLDVPDRAAHAMRTVSDVVDGLEKLARGEELELPEPPPSADPTTAVEGPGTKPPEAAGG